MVSKLYTFLLLVATVIGSTNASERVPVCFLDFEGRLIQVLVPKEHVEEYIDTGGFTGDCTLYVPRSLRGSK